MGINSRPELHDAIRVVADALVASPAAMQVFGASLVEIARTGEGLSSDEVLFDFFDALGVEGEDAEAARIEADGHDCHPACPC